MAFAMGAGLPLLAGAFIADWRMRITSVCLVSAAALVLFGSLGAALGGAKVSKGALRVLVGGCIAMGVTYAIGAAFAAVAGPSFKMAA
jgi:VIT1/CCC1 family predicted Fe2+/Mn2+ transporter